MNVFTVNLLKIEFELKSFITEYIRCIAGDLFFFMRENLLFYVVSLGWVECNKGLTEKCTTNNVPKATADSISDQIHSSEVSPYDTW